MLVVVAVVLVVVGDVVVVVAVVLVIVAEMVVVAVVLVVVAVVLVVVGVVVVVVVEPRPVKMPTPSALRGGKMMLPFVAVAGSPSNIAAPLTSAEMSTSAKLSSAGSKTPMLSAVLDAKTIFPFWAAAAPVNLSSLLICAEMSTIWKVVASVSARPFGFVAISCYPKVVMMRGGKF